MAIIGSLYSVVLHSNLRELNFNETTFNCRNSKMTGYRRTKMTLLITKVVLVKSLSRFTRHVKSKGDRTMTNHNNNMNLGKLKNFSHSTKMKRKRIWSSLLVYNVGNRLKYNDNHSLMRRVSIIGLIIAEL